MVAAKTDTTSGSPFIRLNLNGPIRRIHGGYRSLRTDSLGVAKVEMIAHPERPMHSVSSPKSAASEGACCSVVRATLRGVTAARAAATVTAPAFVNI